MRTAKIAAVLALAALGGCDVKVKDRGELPKVDIEPGKMPDVEVSTDSLKMPDVEMPDVKMPDMPDVKMPDVKAPHIDLPEVKAPHIELPDVNPGRDRPRNDTTRRP